MSGAYFCELSSCGLVSFSGEDAASFLHGQLTSDVSSLGPHTQYSGYCSPKGRLLATCLLWPRGTQILMALPDALRASIQARLAKYVLRARVKVTDATPDFRLFGIAGDEATATVAAFCDGRMPALHEIVAAEGVEATCLPIGRYLLLARSAEAAVVRKRLLEAAQSRDTQAWAALDVEAGIPVITTSTQEQYVPQMVNLDLVGGVSYTKGCYPGQEIVARTHYLGKLKQRMYRVRLAGQHLAAGDHLYSAEFGPDQASGSILYPDRGSAGSSEALAVLQKSAVTAGPVHLNSLNGPAVEIVPLPYPIPG